MSAKVRFEGKSLPEAFRNKVQENPDRALFASKRAGRWEDLRASEAFRFVRQTVAGLKNLGFKKGDVACIFSDNREEWILTDYAIQALGGCTTAIYTTSSVSSIDYILRQSETRFIFVSTPEMFQRLGKIEAPSVEAVICWDPVSAATSGPRLVQREDFLKAEVSEAEFDAMVREISPEDPAILLYTSGTTGEPKGVLLTQQNIVANIRQMHEAFPLEELSSTISFLPLSHIYERSLHSTLILANIKIHFAESLEKLVENISEVKPDIMIGVPRVFEKMYLKIQEKIRGGSPIKRWLAKAAFSIGKQTVPYRLKEESLPLSLSLLNSIGDQLVLKKIRNITGGRLRFFVSGGAPLSKEIAEFFFQTGITILEGYGLSETIILCVNLPGKIKFGTVGLPFRYTHFKIAEDGEILVKGPQVMGGYYKRPDFTAEVFTEDGWFKTGDIGEIDADGFLKITDRKKELIVTAGGKKVAPQMLENHLKGFPLIEQVCVVGDRQKYITALVVPSLEMCRSWLKARGESPQTLEACANSALIKEEIGKIINQMNEQSGRFETIKYFKLLSQPFTIDGGELTPTMKLKRRVIQEKYQKEILSMYPGSERIAS